MNHNHFFFKVIIVVVVVGSTRANNNNNKKNIHNLISKYIYILFIIRERDRGLIIFSLSLFGGD